MTVIYTYPYYLFNRHIVTFFKKGEHKMQNELLENKELQQRIQALIDNNIDDNISLGRFGRIIFDNLKEHKQLEFMQLKMSGTLLKTVKNKNDEAIEMFLNIQKELLKNDPLPNTDDILMRTKHLNKLRGIAEEIVISEIIF